jgi:DNA-binding beta-propeller fold protein YncE
MKKVSASVAALASLAALLVTAAPADARERPPATIFAVLPDGSTGPEGLTVGSDGNVYVTTFGFNASDPVDGNGRLFVFGPDGRLRRQVAIAGSSVHLLGLAFHPTTGALLVLDFGSGQVLRVDPATGRPPSS